MSVERQGPYLGAGEDRFTVTRDLNLPVNPFTDEFLDEELEFYDLRKPYSKDGVQVRLVKPAGRLDDYLNKNWRVPRPDLQVPALFVDGELWMSLTYMEIQSLYVPITSAAGIVGTAGLGLGYFALRTAALKQVERVDVFEVEPRVVEFFKARFGDRPEAKKINITVGDARKKMLRRSFDFIFMDVYQTLLGDDVIDDIRLFNKEASFQEYRFWGQERVLLDSMMGGERPPLSYLEKAFFRKWKLTESAEGDFVLPDMYEPISDEAYWTAVFEALGEVA
jgi:hypothetical protein